MSLFSHSEINTGRQAAVDMAKFFAIVFMVIIHTIEGGDGNVDSGAGYFFDRVTGGLFAAPVFMAAMGIGIAYSRHADAGTMLRRGGKLLLAGYLLNAVRALPVLALVWLKGDDSYYARTVYELTANDILHFAGMAFLLMGLLKSLKLNMWWTFFVAAALSVTGHFVRMVDTGNFWLNLVLSPFVGVDSELVYSFFPLLNWFMFVVAGYGMGWLIRRCKNLNRLFLLATPVAVIAFGAYVAYAVPNGWGMFGGGGPETFYQMRLPELGVCLICVVISLGVGHFLAMLLGGTVMPRVTRICTDLTRIYIVSWIIIMWLLYVPVTNYLEIELGIWPLVGIGIVIMGISVLLARVRPLSTLKI